MMSIHKSGFYLWNSLKRQARDLLEAAASFIGWTYAAGEERLWTECSQRAMQNWGGEQLQDGEGGIS